MFFSIICLDDYQQFTYSIRKKNSDGEDLLLKGPFNFRTNIHPYTSPNIQTPGLSDPPSIKVITFGDHDQSGKLVYNSLLNEDPDLLVLLGDYSYDVQDNKGLNGDVYFEWMEPILATTPVILTPGNHENFDNAEFFNSRFAMPGTRSASDNNLFAVETQHLQILSLNFDYLMMNEKEHDTMRLVFSQAVDKMDERKDNHFKLFVSHRPLHCQEGYDECVKLASDFAAFEKKLTTSKINLNLWGHVHHYERLKAIYRHQVLEPTNMFSLIVGTGGNKEEKPETESRPSARLIGRCGRGQRRSDG